MEGSSGDSTAVVICLVVASSLSCIASALVVASYIRLPPLRRHPGSLMVARSVADLVFCLSTSLSVSLDLHTQTPASEQDVDRACLGFALLTQFSAMAAEGFFLALAVDLVLSTSNPFTNFKENLWRYFGLTVLISLATTIVLGVARDNGAPVYGRDNTLSLCWIKRYRFGTSDSNAYFYAMWAVPLVSLWVSQGTARSSPPLFVPPRCSSTATQWWPCSPPEAVSCPGCRRLLWRGPLRFATP